MHNNQSRRRFLFTGTALVATLSMRPAFALSTGQARSLVDAVVAEINRIISSGKSESQMYGDFERLFLRYADVAIIAQSILGRADWGRASAAQRQAYIAAFAGYISRKYGKRFREFIGGEIVVQDARQLKSFHEVRATAVLQGMAPFEVAFRVSDKSGRDLFFDMLIEGISLLKVERTEVGAMLDRRKGDLNGMISDLQRAG